MWYEVTTDNDQRRINQFLEKLDKILGQGNQYALNLDGLDYFFNDDVTDHFGGKQGPYTGPENMLDVNSYVNEATDAKAEFDSYETYIGAELNLPDLDGNPVQ